MMPFRLSRDTLLLSGILVLALFVRLWGIGFGLPYLYHADEPIVVNHALAFGSGDLNPHFFKIPPLVSYLLFLCYGLYFAVGAGIGIFHSVRDFEYLFYFDPSSFYLIARLAFGAFLGTASVYLLFRIVKKFWGSQAALWTSFFLAVNFLHVRDSHYIYADISLVFVLLLGFYVFFRMACDDRHCEEPATDSKVGDAAISLRKNKIASLASCFRLPTGEAGKKARGRNDVMSGWPAHLLAGAMIGLATAVKYNGAFLAIPYLWICLRNVPWKKWPGCWVLAGLGASVTFIVLNPYAVLDHVFFVNEIAAQSAANSGGFPWFHHLTYSLAGGMGWPMLAVGLLGTLWALFGKDRRSQAVAVFVVAYYAVLCLFGQPYDRYALPLIPFILILAVELLLRLKNKSNLIFWVVIPFVALPSILKTVHWDRLMSEPDVRTISKEWVETRIPEGSRIALDWGFYMPRLAFSPKQLEEKRSLATEGFQSEAKSRRLDALLSKPQQPSYELYFLSTAPEGSGFMFGEPRIPFDLEELKRKGVEYVFMIEDLHPEGTPFMEALRANADRIMTFSPYRNTEDLQLHDGFTMTGGPFLWGDILLRERGGYPFSIYKIRD